MKTLTQRPVHAIHTDEEYQEYQREIDELLDDDSVGAQERLEVISLLVQAWEDEHHELPPPDPIEALRFIMEQRGLSTKDIEPMIGSRARVSEVLSGKRRLSLTMIRRLARALQVPADVFVGA